MDLDTENRIAAILMKEAAELRRQADKEGVHAYLRKPNTRFRPNSRFLTATVLGVQQANRAVEVNEMWSVRQKELEMDNRLKGRVRSERSSAQRHGGNSDRERSTSKREAYAEPGSSVSSIGCSSSKRTIEECYWRDDKGSKGDSLDAFLHSRVKRGRGGVGPRMDEPGPYLPPQVDSKEDKLTDNDRWERRVVLGPQKPPSLVSSKYYEKESLQHKCKKADNASSSKRCSSKNKLKDKARDKKKKRRKDEKRSKRHT